MNVYTVACSLGQIKVITDGIGDLEFFSTGLSLVYFIGAALLDDDAVNIGLFQRVPIMWNNEGDFSLSQCNIDYIQTLGIANADVFMTVRRSDAEGWEVFKAIVCKTQSKSLFCGGNLFH